MADSAGIEYLREVLRLDPLEDAERILALRQSRLAGADAVGVAVGDDGDQDDRRRAAAALDRLRRDFWMLDEARFRGRLEELDERRFPELAVALARLRVVASHRQALLDPCEPTDPAAPFAEALRRVLVAPPRDAALLRDAHLAALVEAARRRDPRLQAAQRLIARIAEQQPELHLLEDEWLAAIGRIGPDRPGWIVRAWRSGVPRFVIALALAVLLAWKVFQS
jgi:hypothetical protein